MKCVNCGKPEHMHVQGMCQMSTTISISAEALERVIRTKHPRLLALVLADQERTLLTGVHIQEVRLV